MKEKVKLMSKECKIINFYNFGSIKISYPGEKKKNTEKKEAEKKKKNTKQTKPKNQCKKKEKKEKSSEKLQEKIEENRDQDILKNTFTTFDDFPGKVNESLISQDNEIGTTGNKRDEKREKTDCTTAANAEKAVELCTPEEKQGALTEKHKEKRLEGIPNVEISQECSFKGIPAIEKTLYMRHRSYLNAWTKCTSFDQIFDSNDSGLTTAAFNEKVGGQKNVLLLIFSKKGYLFGSFHSSVPTEPSMLRDDPKHFVFSLSSPFLETPTQFMGNGILHTHSSEDDSTVFDLFSGYSVYENNTVMVYSTFAQAYGSDPKNLLGKINSKTTINKLVAFTCI
ncbi:hypothetical protein EIN_268260 [Entamoeba invadens IP1]|uniref:TLDc domain-containing protein n=1 Tax=Entamoeba invadens IP1 TaxID=370355 RepID=A0A0A1UE50_ENTIV|nr:hypothetical protein EIN_268260 [Entamoeba invadens IP1]ELP91080.1 hypothetical protein EIN_268260 [Entamoeba invadens IP1]|eukprot:XP_004257851.1 hypothetical protein EIN_268260 [Entamoeba invadens IP1]